MPELAGLSPQGIGVIGAVINLVVGYVATMSTPPPPVPVQELVDSVRYPSGVDPLDEELYR